MTEEVHPASATPLSSDGKEVALIPAETPRVRRSPLVQSGEFFTLNSWDTADGKTRLLMPMDATDEEIQAGIEALEESDRELESLRKVSEALDNAGQQVEDPEPQPEDGPEYEANHAAWRRRQEEVIIAELEEDE